MDTVTFKETVDAFYFERMADADCIRTDAGCGSITNAVSSYNADDVDYNCSSIAAGNNCCQ